jgi:hypothetical protein
LHGTPSDSAVVKQVSFSPRRRFTRADFLTEE